MWTTRRDDIADLGSQRTDGRLRDLAVVLLAGGSDRRPRGAWTSSAPAGGVFGIFASVIREESPPAVGG